MPWPTRRPKTPAKDAFESGFEAPSETWAFDSAHLSPVQCEFVRLFARSRNQEPCNEECMVQQLAQGEQRKDDDTRRLAIRARIGVSGHEAPWSRDEVATFVADAIRGARRLTREKLAREGLLLCKWSGDELGTLDEVQWPPRVVFQPATDKEEKS